MQVQSADTFRDDRSFDPPRDSSRPSPSIASSLTELVSRRSRTVTAMLVLLLVSIAVQWLGVFHRNVNWDEFLFLSIVHQVANGESVSPLQTSYAHLFGWLTHIEGNEITRITVARLIYVVIWAGSLVLLYHLARQLLDPFGALAGVLLFALFSYSVVHAASFRIDGLVLPVLIAVALLLLNPTIWRVAGAGALSGVALALTIKSVLWAPGFVGMLALGLWHEQSRMKPVLAGTAAAFLTYSAVMLAHVGSLTTADAPAIMAPAMIAPAEALPSIGFRMLLEDGFFPRLTVLIRALLLNPMTWLLILIGYFVAFIDLWRAPLQRRAALLLLLSLPLGSVAFYANAWPYAYLIFMPTACLLAGHALSRFAHDGGVVRRAAAAFCIALAAIPMAASAWSLRLDWQDHQKQILSIVHNLFPEPVAYIDKGGMVSSFPMQPLFLSRWGMKNYRDAGVPVFSRYIREAHPPLLIVNTPILDVWDEATTDRDEQFSLSAEDVEALRRTYAPYWSKIYLAGRQWHDLGGGETVSFEIVIPGDYTLLSRHSAVVDGRSHAPGVSLRLDSGPHTLQPTKVEPDLRLLWGRGITIPPQEPSSMPIYTGF